MTKDEITVGAAARLVAAQFPQWAGLWARYTRTVFGHRTDPW